jgi:hypothetical protein
MWKKDEWKKVTQMFASLNETLFCGNPSKRNDIDSNCQEDNTQITKKHNH